MTSILAEIATANAEWIEMLKKGDVKGMTDSYTEDCQLLPPGEPPMFGREAAQKKMEDNVTAGCKDATLTTDQVDPNASSVPEGGTFWETGSLTLYKEGGAVIYNGKYLLIRKKVTGGRLLTHVDMWNSNE